MSQTTWTPSPEEEAYYKILFDFADKSKVGSFAGQEAFQFLMLSGLPQDVLNGIWFVCDEQKASALDIYGFYKVCRFISIVQNGLQLSPEAINQFANEKLKLPVFQGAPPPPNSDGAPAAPTAPTDGSQAPVAPPAQAPARPPPRAAAPRQPRPPQNVFMTTDQERMAYKGQFGVLDTDQDGFLNEEEVKNYLTQCQITPELQTKIFHLSDLDKDGKLDASEFIVACHLAVCMLARKTPVPDVLPPILIPPSKQHLLQQGSPPQQVPPGQSPSGAPMISSPTMQPIPPGGDLSQPHPEGQIPPQPSMSPPNQMQPPPMQSPPMQPPPMQPPPMQPTMSSPPPPATMQPPPPALMAKSTPTVRPMGAPSPGMGPASHPPPHPVQQSGHVDPSKIAELSRNQNDIISSLESTLNQLQEYNTSLLNKIQSNSSVISQQNHEIQDINSKVSSTQIRINTLTDKWYTLENNYLKKSLNNNLTLIDISNYNPTGSKKTENDESNQFKGHRTYYPNLKFDITNTYTGEEYKQAKGGAISDGMSDSHPTSGSMDMGFETNKDQPPAPSFPSGGDGFGMEPPQMKPSESIPSFPSGGDSFGMEPPQMKPSESIPTFPGGGSFGSPSLAPAAPPPSFPSDDLSKPTTAPPSFPAPPPSFPGVAPPSFPGSGPARPPPSFPGGAPPPSFPGAGPPSFPGAGAPARPPPSFPGAPPSFPGAPAGATRPSAPPGFPGSGPPAFPGAAPPSFPGAAPPSFPGAGAPARPPPSFPGAPPSFPGAAPPSFPGSAPARPPPSFPGAAPPSFPGF